MCVERGREVCHVGRWRSLLHGVWAYEMCVWKERMYCEILVVCGEWERGREVRRLAKMFVNVCVGRMGEREKE